MLENDHFLPGAESLNLGTSRVKCKHAVYGDSKINHLDSFSCIPHCRVAAWYLVRSHCYYPIGCLHDQVKGAGWFLFLKPQNVIENFETSQVASNISTILKPTSKNCLWTSYLPYPQIENSETSQVASNF